MATTISVKVLEVCQVLPISNSTESETEFSLPLTFLDLQWLKFPPVVRLFFYQLAEASSEFFNSVILPKLKHSLSLTLLHFLPVAGRLTWPSNSPKPIILYSPNNGVPLTFVESDTDLDRLSSHEIVDVTESHPYVPELPISETTSSILALKITLFPNKGFIIGCSCHHAVLDGKSSTMFMKAWAYICKHGSNVFRTGPEPELAPFYDRTDIKDPAGLETMFLTQWAILTESEWKKNPRSLKVFPDIGVAKNQVRSTFLLTRENINKLKNEVLSELGNSVGLSTFVLTCAYVTVCMVKARGGDSNRKVWFLFTVDCRNRLDPPLPENYFGNCVVPRDFITDAREFMSENGVSIVAKRISGMIKELENGVLEGIDEKLLKIKSLQGVQGISVAGSTRFEVYGCDFGWGKPKKVEVTSIDRTGAISLAEGRDGNGGVEIGLVMSRGEMEAFSSIFVDGLKDL